MKLKIAFLQLLPVGSLKENMEKGIKACFQAKEKGADIAIFPEMWSCGYIFPHEEASLGLTELILLADPDTLKDLLHLFLGGGQLHPLTDQHTLVVLAKVRDEGFKITV